MSQLRHTDMRLTTNLYTDPRIFDLAGAVAMLPSFTNSDDAQAMKATGTNGKVEAGAVKASIVNRLAYV